MNIQSAHLLNGKTIDYTYEGGWRFKLRFYDGKIAYEFLGEQGAEVSNRNEDIPYQSRQIRDSLYHVMWHEENIKDMVSLVIDFANNTLYSAALLDYGSDQPMTHFESAIISEVFG